MHFVFDALWIFISYVCFFQKRLLAIIMLKTTNKREIEKRLLEPWFEIQRNFLGCIALLCSIAMSFFILDSYF
jgi:hypothetical protein